MNVIRRTGTIVAAGCLIAVAWRSTALGAATRPFVSEERQAQYACPMHSDVTSTKPGACPKCGMSLRKLDPESRAGVPHPADSTKGVIHKLKIPETYVYDQHGRKLRFNSDLVAGKTVVINFIFTTCTTICPPLTATFRRVQQSLGERVGQDIALISVSVDPTVDTPERLKSFGDKFNARYNGWTFVTGRPSDMDSLLGALGAAVANKTDHSPMVLIGNEPAGYWTRAYGLAPASKLVEVILDVANRTGEAARK